MRPVYPLICLWLSAPNRTNGFFPCGRGTVIALCSIGMYRNGRTDDTFMTDSHCIQAPFLPPWIRRLLSPIIATPESSHPSRPPSPLADSQQIMRFFVCGPLPTLDLYSKTYRLVPRHGVVRPGTDCPTMAVPDSHHMLYAAISYPDTYSFDVRIRMRRGPSSTDLLFHHYPNGRT